MIDEKIYLKYPTLDLIADKYIKDLNSDVYTYLVPQRYCQKALPTVPLSFYKPRSNVYEYNTLHVAIDFPVLLKSNNPNGYTIAIIGERPNRNKEEWVNKYPLVSMNLTFGQSLEKYKESPRGYDMLIDYYLEKGYDVYVTNFNKSAIFRIPWKINSFRITENDLDLMIKEFEIIKPCHVILLGDTSNKRFWFSKLPIGSANIYPHLSPANNNAWKKILGKGVQCTDKNKVDYITDPNHTNILFPMPISK